MSPRYTYIQLKSDLSFLYVEEIDGPFTYTTFDRDKVNIIEDGVREHEVTLFDEVEAHVLTLDDVDRKYPEAIVRSCEDDRDWDDA
jgi:hypothetical protein